MTTRRDGSGPGGSRRWVRRLVLVLLGAVFFWAGAVKVGDPAAFAGSVATYRLVPGPVAMGIALILPWLEVLAAAALLWPAWRRGALLILGVLALVFAAALAQGWARGLSVDCGCFGAGAAAERAWDYVRLLGRSAALLALVVWAWILTGGPAGPDRA